MKHKTKLYKRQRSAKYAHVKRDGNWLTVKKDAYGVVECITSTPTDITHQLKHLNWYLNVLKYVPPCTILHGELWMRNKPASYVKTAIKEKENQLLFHVFAVESFPAAASLEWVAERVELWGLRFVPFLALDSRVGISTSPEFLFTMLQEQHGNDVEGIVFKNGNLGDWYKWKPIKTIDLIIEGFTDGDGKYLGLIGSIICRTHEGNIVANVSGMDDLTRAEISLDEEGHFFKIIEVEYQCVGSKGKLRHPRFKRFRDDKQHHECGLNQDPDLQRYHNVET